jgi:uncharacterized membrane protein YfcA
MFLVKAGLAKEEFIGINVVLAVMVDLVRLVVYGIGFYSIHANVLTDIVGLVLAATLSAFIGAYFGREVLKKVTLRALRMIVGVTIIVLGLAMGVGLV